MRKVIQTILIFSLITLMAAGCNNSGKENGSGSDSGSTQDISLSEDEGDTSVQSEADSDKACVKEQESSRNSQADGADSNSGEEKSEVSKEPSEADKEVSEVSKEESEVSEEVSEDSVYEQETSNEEPEDSVYEQETSNEEPEDSEYEQETSNEEPEDSGYEQEASEEEPEDSGDQATPLRYKVSPVSQYPELPTGCEITALATVLQYYGFDADKCDLADNYLEKAQIGYGDFHYVFLGDPRSQYSYGCYAPAIVTAANRYLEEHNSQMKAHDISGSDFDQLVSYANNGRPVMIWCTMYLNPGYYTTSWNINGNTITWYANEHCMVLLGDDGDLVYTSDPMTGSITAYSRDLMETRYEELFQQAVIIY